MNLPPELFQQLQSRARAGKKYWLDNILDIRDDITEREDEIKRDGGMMAYYDKCADAMDCAPATVRDDLGIIRNYPDEKLRYWFHRGLGKDHIEAANWLQDEPQCKYDALTLLDKAIEFGGATGKRMTVNELTEFALGEKTPRPPTYRYVQTLTNWMHSVPRKMGWDEERGKAFGEAVAKFVEEWFR